MYWCKTSSELRGLQKTAVIQLGSISLKAFSEAQNTKECLREA